MGCDVIQGFLIAMPMAMGDLRSFLDARTDATPESSLGFNWLGRGGQTG